MSNNVRHDSDDMRGRADIHSGVAPGFRDRGVDDPDWDASLGEGGGTGVYPWQVLSRKIREARSAGWTTVADGHDGAGRAGYQGATTFDDADGSGSADVKGRDL
ncbi:hypothetical protein [Nocardia testacea]|uniref:hypothetical protein n=1 Tax=Nocardia testacea TaxID=248551 RepID=UPI003A8C4589